MKRRVFLGNMLAALGMSSAAIQTGLLSPNDYRRIEKAVPAAPLGELQITISVDTTDFQAGLTEIAEKLERLAPGELWDKLSALPPIGLKVSGKNAEYFKVFTDRETFLRELAECS